MPEPHPDARLAPRAVIRDLLGRRSIAYHPTFAAIGGVTASVFLAQIHYRLGVHRLIELLTPWFHGQGSAVVPGSAQCESATTSEDLPLLHLCSS